MANLNFFLTICSLFIVLCSLFWAPDQVGAQNMSSQNYQIQGGNFNIAAGTKSSSSYRLVDLVGQTASQIFASKGYIVQSGFLNTAATSILSFSVSPLTVNFGKLTPNQPVIKNLFISVTVGNIPGYIVYTTQDMPLSTDVGSEIADTVCDGQKNRLCTTQKANLWQETDSYGLGFRLEGKTVPKDFAKANFYRPFSSLSKNELAQTIMQSSNKKAADTAKMLLKVNISRNQPVGIYHNQLIFTAMPGI